MTGLQYNLIDSKEDLKLLESQLNSVSEYVFDLESTGLATHSEDIQIVGIGFCWQSGVTYYIPFNGNLTSNEILNAVRSSLENDSIRKIGHNFKFDSRLLNRFGIKVRGLYFDTMIASYAIYGDRVKHNLDDSVLHHLNHIKIRTKSVIPKKNKTNPSPSMMDTTIKDVATYCGEDVDFTYRLYLLLKDKLNQPEFLVQKSTFYEVDMPLCAVLIKMECNGIKLDEKILEEMRLIVSQKLVDLQLEINNLAGRELSLTKPADIARCLYEEHQVHTKLNVKVPKTASGQYSTSASTLAMLKKDPLVFNILEYKMNTKLMSTYIAPLPEFISKKTGFIHPFFSQTRTATARLAASEPNVQQQPNRNKIGRKIREAYVSRFPEGKILAIDYSQAELRILAHMAEEKVFIKAFNNNEDVHKTVASEIVFSVPPEEVTLEQRTIVKTINFGLLYGMRAKKLSKELKIEFQEAETIMSNYMGKMSGLKGFLDKSRKTLNKQGYTENYFGRKRYIPKIYSEDQLDKWSAEREGANSIIQSTNADIIRRAMIKIQEYLDNNNMKSLMILQIHDELVFDVHPSEIDVLLPNVKDIMESIVQFKVKMVAEGSYADNWSLAH